GRGAAGRLRHALLLLRPRRLRGSGGGRERPRAHRAVPRQVSDAAGCLRDARLHRLYGDVPRLRDGKIPGREQGVGGPDGRRWRVHHREGRGEMAAGPFRRLQARRLPGEGKGPGRTEERMGSVHRHGLDGRRAGHAAARLARLLMRPDESMRPATRASAAPPGMPSAFPGGVAATIDVVASAAREIIRTEGVSKRFDAQVAVDRVDYVLREYEVAGIIGSNGAGKTTFFNLLTGYYVPDEGTIRYEGAALTRLSPPERVAPRL